ncbi:MAG TPA: MOSC domain-containing protein [Thermoleophilaceae bacterium]|nr:MOSC domain-containing protein [Thermoleophilaceae bacterium]
MGAVEGLFVVGATGADRDAVEHVRVVAGRGPEGDRHFRAPGAPPNEEGMGRDLTLIEAEALEALAGAGIELEPGEHLRNVVTRDVRLDDLIGKPFRVGGVRCVGVEPCHPCRRLERHTGRRGLLKGLAGRGGLRADVVRGGEIAVGDAVEPV